MDGEKLPVEERWSGRYFTLDKVFRDVIIDKETVVVDLDWYHGIDNWESYCSYLASPYRIKIARPFKGIMDYREFNGIGTEKD